MGIDDFITDFRKKYGKKFFLNGGCYIFARILQVNFGGVIYSNVNHCVLKKGNMFYDINGQVENKNYRTIDESVEKRYKNFENFD